MASEVNTYTMKELPIIKLTIDPNDTETGVEVVALVDSPAIQMNWQAFNGQTPRQTFAVQDEEKRIVSGPLMVADLPIYRRDEDGREYYVVFDADTIRAIVYKYFKNGRNTGANLMHETSVEGVYQFESWITSESKPVPQGFDPLPEGSWFGSFKVDNDEVWATIKDGTFKGFSVEGMFKDGPTKTEDETIIEEIIKQITE